MPGAGGGGVSVTLNSETNYVGGGVNFPNKKSKNVL